MPDVKEFHFHMELLVQMDFRRHGMAEGARMTFFHSGQLRPLGGPHFPLPRAANERGGDLCDLGGDLSGKRGAPSGPHLDLATLTGTQQEAGSHAAGSGQPRRSCGLPRSSSGLPRSGGDLLRSGGGLPRSGGGLPRSRGGLRRSRGGGREVQYGA